MPEGGLGLNQPVVGSGVLSASRIDVGKNAARGLAALAVAIDHAYGFFIQPHVKDSLMSVLLEQGGYQAVYIFFIISGFLITKSILDNVSRNGTFNFFEFALSRLARIYPPLVFSVGLCLVFLLLIKGFGLPGSGSEIPYKIGIYPQMRDVFQFSIVDVIRALQMSNGLLVVNGPLWSLCIEWWIYVMVGFSVLMVMGSGIVRKLIAGILLVISIQKLFAVNQNSAFYLTVWLSGALAAVVNSRYSLFKTKRWDWLIVLLCSIAVIGSLFPSLIFAGSHISGFLGGVFQLLVVIFWCALVLPEVKYYETIAWRSLMRLGGCSYTLYIVHFPIMLVILSVFQHAFQTTLVNSIAAAFVAAFVAIVISFFSAKFFENKKLFTRYLTRTSRF